MKKRDLTTGNIPRNIWFLAWPIIISYLLHVGVGIVDLIMVGQLGEAQVAAVFMSNTVLMFFFTIIISIATGNMIYIARYTGEKSFRKVERVFRTSITFAILVSIFIITPLGMILSKTAFKLLGAKPDVMDHGVSYLNIRLAGFLFFAINMICSTGERGTGDSRTPLIIMLIANVLNVIGNYFLIFGHWFFPKLEVDGAAIASIFAKFIGVVIWAIIIYSGKGLLRLNIKDLLGMSLTYTKKIFRLGVPNSLQALVRNSMNLGIISIIARTEFTTDAVAAYGIGLHVMFVSAFIGLGFMTAATAIVGQNLGASKPSRAGRSGWTAAVMAMIIMGSLGVLIVIFSEYIVAIFSQPEKVVELCLEFFIIFAFALPFIGLNMTLGGALRGAGDTISPFLYSLIARILVILPLAYIMGIRWNMQTRGIWIAICIGAFIQACLCFYKFKLGKWKEIKI